MNRSPSASAPRMAARYQRRTADRSDRHGASRADCGGGPHHDSRRRGWRSWGERRRRDEEATIDRTADAVRGQRLDLLCALGFDRLQHDSHVPFLSHLLGTRRILTEWGCHAALCDAGLFHSAYGTEYFPTDRTPTPETRAAVREVIGRDAERLAWLWCTIRRDRLDPDGPSALDRHDGSLVELTGEELVDLATLWAADTVEQLARMDPDERGFATGLHSVLAFAPAPARTAALTALDAAPPRHA